MESPSAVATLGAPYAIDLLDEDGEIAMPAQHALTLPPGASLVVYKPGELPLDAPFESAALFAFRWLHLAVAVDGTAVARLRKFGPITDVWPLHPSFAWTYPLVRALDEFANLLILNQLPAERLEAHMPAETHAFRIGGRSAQEPHGYPTWDGEPGSEIVAGKEQWPTEPMLVPVLNLSLGPNSVRFPLDPGDAVQAATLFLSRATLVSAAAGNSGEIRRFETLSAWAQVPWVVAVGATDSEDGGSLLPRSSRGLPDRPETWPDVVAYGASALDPGRRGTSFAAPRVAYCAVLATAALLYLRHLAQRALKGRVEGIRLLGICFADRFRGDRWYGGAQRLPLGVLPDLPQLATTGSASAVLASLVTAGWDGRLELGPNQVSALVKESARPLERYEGYQQGAGFVSEKGMLDHITGLSGEGWLRILGLHGFARALPAALLAKPFFAGAAAEQLNAIVRSSMQTVMIDWPTGKWKFRPEGDST